LAEALATHFGATVVFYWLNDTKNYDVASSLLSGGDLTKEILWGHENRFVSSKYVVGGPVGEGGGGLKFTDCSHPSHGGFTPLP